MSTWSHGYVSDITYTYGYYSELNPLRAQMALLDARLAPPNSGADATCCELGFGQGLSANVHAAAGGGARWWATDFNPAQAGFAQSLARASGSGAVLVDDAFADFANRKDLPPEGFDYIGLHGIWSWISDANRAVIVDFVRRHLKVGGVLYISYNALPGWAALMPLRHLLTQHAERLGGPGTNIVSKINDALAFADKLVALNPGYARSNPVVAERLKRINGQNRNYLAHEYFNRDWLPMHFSDMAAWLEPAKLSFAGSAHYLERVDAINLNADQQKLLNDLPDPLMREQTRDYITNTQFRRDYWVRGARSISALERSEALRQQRVVLSTPRADVAMKVNGNLGEASLNDNVYTPVLDALADQKAHTLGQLEQAVAAKNVSFNQLAQAIMILVGKGDLQPAHDDAHIARARKTTDRLNTHLMNLSRGSSDISNLASPVTGGGVGVGRFQQLFIAARAQGKKTAPELAQAVWTILQAQGQRIVKDGKALDNNDDNLAELNTQATTFLDKQLAVFKALGVA